MKKYFFIFNLLLYINLNLYNVNADAEKFYKNAKEEYKTRHIEKYIENTKKISPNLNNKNIFMQYIVNGILSFADYAFFLYLKHKKKNDDNDEYINKKDDLNSIFNIAKYKNTVLHQTFDNVIKNYCIDQEEKNKNLLKSLFYEASNAEEFYEILTTNILLKNEFKNQFKKIVNKDKFFEFFNLKMHLGWLNFALQGLKKKNGDFEFYKKEDFKFKMVIDKINLHDILNVAQKFIENNKNEIMKKTVEDKNKYNIEEDIKLIENFSIKFNHPENMNNIGFSLRFINDLNDIKGSVERVFFCEEKCIIDKKMSIIETFNKVRIIPKRINSMLIDI